MLKFGSIVLTVYGTFNLVLAASVLVAITVFRKNPPILFIAFEEGEISRLDSKVLETTRALAVYFNASAAGCSLLSMFVVWCALVKGQYWAFWALLLGVGFVQAMAFVADAAIGTKTLIPNLVLTVLFIVGIGFAGYGLFRS